MISGAARGNRLLTTVFCLLTTAFCLLTTAVAVTAQARPAVAPRPVVTLYGAAGTFGALTAGTLPNGQSYATGAANGWAFHPGQSAWFSAAGPDGTIFIPNQPQTTNPFIASAADMAMSLFYPATDTLQTANIPTSLGAVTATVNPTGPPYQPCAGSACGIGGADIEDTQALSDGEIAFDSASPWNGWNQGTLGVYPTYGTFKRNPATGAWAPNLSVTAAQIQQSNTTLIPPTDTVTVGQQACPTVAGYYNNCLNPAEMALFPRSHNLIVAQYSPNTATGQQSGHLMVLSPSGALLASYIYPSVVDPTVPYSQCAAQSGGFLSIHPREVDADPTGVPGDERFAVIFDTWHCDSTTTHNDPAPFVLQEFKYNAAAPPYAAITPVSAPILPDATDSFERAHYDHWGNLWAGTMQTAHQLVGSNIVVYARINGVRKLQTACAATAPGAAWGMICSPDYPTLAYGIPVQNELAEGQRLGQPAGIQEDSAHNALYLFTSSGYVLPLTIGDNPATGAMTFTMHGIDDLGLTALKNGQNLYLYPSKGAITGAGLPSRRGVLHTPRAGYAPMAVHTPALWIPLQQQLTPASPLPPQRKGGTTPPPGQTWWVPDPPRPLDQWLYRVNLDDILNPPAVALSPATPATLQAENFAAYTGRIFVAQSLDTGGSMDVSMGSGTSTGYAVTVPVSGTYAVTYRVANGHGTSGSIVLTALGTAITTTIPAGSWSAYQSVTSTVTLPAGTYRLTLAVPASSPNVNLNYVTIGP